MGLSWTSGFAPSEEASIYFEVTTPERPSGVVMFAHGGRGSHVTWYQQVPVFAPTHTVITWDCRGFGRSTSSGGELSSEAVVADMESVLDAASVVDPVHLVGQSMAGWWVTAFALGHPDRVRSVTHCGSSGGMFTDELDAHWRAAIGALAEPPVLGVHFAFGTRFATEHLTRAFLFQQLGTLAPAQAAIGTAMRERFDRQEVAALGLPTLFALGLDDPIYPPALVRPVVDELHAGLATFDAGHSPYFETPDEFNDVLRRHVLDAD